MERILTGAIASVLLLGACGGGGGADGADDAESDMTTGGEGGEDTSVEAVADVAWADMDHEQRGAFMQETVMPEMTAMFQEFDGERYANLTCNTCHGEDAADVNFAMPNGMAPLNPEHIGPMFQSDEPMAVFMTQQVWPRMAELLQEAPFNPETNEGFSCMNCHATEGG